MTNQRILTTLAVLLAAACPGAHAAECTPVAINAVDAGWYDDQGNHTPSNDNYFCGYLSGAKYRNWFVFSIPPLTQPVASAALRVYSFDVNIPRLSETYELRQVTTPVSTLRAGGSGLTNIHADLGDGTTFGSRTFLPAESGQFVTIPLNAAFLSLLAASSGGTLALGGQLVGVQGASPGDEYLFGGSALIGYVQLLVTYSNAVPLTIVEQPASLTVMQGDAASFQVRVCGRGAPSYQWQHSGTNLPGATGPSLLLPNPASQDNGSYRVLITESLNTVTSADATLTVSNGIPPSGYIYLNSGASSLLVGSSASFCSSIGGLPQPAYQWQLNGTNLPGQSGSCIFLSNLQTNQSGNYRLVATNVAGAFTSAPISLVVSQAAPSGSIYLAGGSLPPLAGAGITLCSSIVAGPPPALQWQLNGTNLPGQTGGCIGLPNVQSNNNGSYRIVATNSVGAFTSAPIVVAVQYFAPTGRVFLTSGPSPVPAGSAVTFCTDINAAPPPVYQWQFNGMNLPGENNSCLYLGSVSSNQAGLYRLIATNTQGAFTSAPIALNVEYHAPTGSIYLASGLSPAPAGSFVYFCSTISAAPAATFQWQLNGTNLPGRIGSCLDISVVSSNDAGSYRLVASNSVGIFTSAPIALAVNYYAPTGTISPTGVLPSVVAGNTVTICSSINGAPPPAYQWQLNGTNLPGQTGYCLSLYGAQTNQSGSYRLIAANSVGAFTSSVAVVSIVYAPPTAQIYRSFGHTPTTVGSSVQLCATVNGAPAPTVQWRFNGTNLPAQTGTCLTLFNLQTNQSGPYTIVASNALGVVTSAVAVITVIEPVPVLAYFANDIPPLAVGSYQNLCAETSLPGPLAFQWLFQGTNLPNETNVCLTLYPIAESHVGDYAVVATNFSGSYTSPPITLTVFYDPPRLAYPYFLLGNSFALVGQDISLAAGYYGSPGFVQWRFNDVELPDQTNGILALLAVTTNQAGLYSFTVSNVAGMATSTVVSLNVYYQEPQWVSYSGSQTVTEGTTARFPAYATAGPPPVYFLELEGTNVAVPFTYEGCCGPSAGGFSLLDTTFADAGHYRIIASNFLGTATSAVATLTVLPAGPLDRWTQRNPLPQSQIIYAVGHGTNQFVAVGDRGTILTSADGSNWALQNRRADLPLYGVAYGNGVFVAVGEGGTILSSFDGTNWAYRYTAPATFLNAVTFGDGRFLAVGSAQGLNTLALLSTDGVHWERVALGSFNAAQCVAYGNGTFVAGGSLSLIYSTDGTNWSLARTVSRQVESITYANGSFVAVGDDGSMLVSTDGISWVARTALTTRRLLGVTYGAGRFVAAGARGTMLTSTDAVTWSAVTSGTPDRLETIDFAGGVFVAAGENGTIITSTNGTAWTKQNFGITRDLDGLAAANGTLVVVGKGGSILTSTDGTHYTVRNAGVTNDLHGVFWGGGLWVAVGEPGVILTSSNAINWSSRTTGTTNSLKDGTFANGRWIAVGTQGTILISSNGVDWAVTTVNPPYDLNDVAYGGGVYLIAGDGPGNVNGSLTTSSDLMNWTVLSPYAGKNLRGITFAEDRFVIAANDGLVVTLPTVGNAVFNYQGAGNLRAAARAPGLWTIVGNDGVILTTTADPASSVLWTRRGSRTFENLHGIAYLDGRLVAIGNRGTILQSGRFVAELASPALAGGSFRIPFRGALNQRYQLEASTNLTLWTPILTFTNATDQTLIEDVNAGQHPSRFYRVTEP